MRFNIFITRTFYTLVLIWLAGCNVEDLNNPENLSTENIDPEAVNALLSSTQTTQEEKPVVVKVTIQVPYPVTGEEEIVVTQDGEGQSIQIVLDDSTAPTPEQDSEPEQTSEASAPEAEAEAEAIEQLIIAGAGIKGPLAFADVALYSLDTSFAGYFDAQAPIAIGNTNAFAAIEGLAIPTDTTLPLVMVVDGPNAVDLDTNAPPVISKLMTIITQEMLDSDQQIYATPLTTMAFYMAQFEEGMNASTSAAIDAITLAARQVSSTVGFGMSAAVDILTTPPIINEHTSSANQQQWVAEHRAAIEALSSVLNEMAGPGANGDGLSAEYFSDTSLSNLALTRIDSSVDFDWGLSAPDAAVPVDGFSARWTGFVQAQYSESYSFHTSSDDGVRLWVNGELLVDSWVDRTLAEDRANIQLQAGQYYAITVEYYDSIGNAITQLQWSSTSQVKQVIPQARLFSSALTLPNDTDALLYTLALDLQSDGVIDNADNGNLLGGIDVTVLTQDPASLMVANTNTAVANIGDILEADLINTNSAASLDKSNIQLDLSAAVVSPDIDNDGILNIDDPVNDDIPPPTLLISETNIEFGSHAVDTTANAIPITLTNSSTGLLPFTHISITGDFRQSNNCSNVFGPEISCVMNITFTPTETGVRQGELTLVTGDDGVVSTIQLVGTGVAQ